MEKFEDNKGRIWQLEVTFPVLKTCKRNGIDLLSALDPAQALDTFKEVGLELQVDAIGYAIQATEQKQEWDVDSFAEALDEEVIWHGCLAFMRSLADFYPSRSVAIREVLTQAQAKMDEAHTKAKEMDPEGIRQLVAASMDSAVHGNGLTNSPDSSESP